MKRARLTLFVPALVLVVACSPSSASEPATKTKSEPELAEPGAKAAGAAGEAVATEHTIAELAFDPQADLSAALAGQVELANEKGQRAFVEFWADWCGPCRELEASMDDPRMKDAFAGVYLVRANSDEWGEKAVAAGYDVGSIPVFYEIDAAGKPTGRTISGGEWAENTPENMAPPLKSFFKGT